MAAAVEDFKEFTERTFKSLRQAAAEDLKAAQDQVAQQEEGLRQWETRLREREQDLKRQVQEFERQQKVQQETAIQGVPNIPATPTPTRSGSPALHAFSRTSLDATAIVAGSPAGTATCNSSPRLSIAAAGTASQLRALFESKGKDQSFEQLQTPSSRVGTPRKDMPQEGRDVRCSTASERDRKESSKLSFRAQEAPLRRSNSGAGLASLVSSGHDQQELQPQWKTLQPLEPPSAIAKAMPEPSPRPLQSSPSEASSPKKQRPPLSPTKKRQPLQAASPLPAAASPLPAGSPLPVASPLMSPQPSPKREQPKQPEQPAKSQPVPKRSLAELLKMDEERCASP